MLRSTLIIVLLICNLLYSCGNTKKDTGEKIVDKSFTKRYGQVIKVKPEKLEYYKKLHANPWPCVVEKIQECNIQNYSIYLQDDFLFAYFEYVGEDFTSDMQKMAEDSCTIKWWKETDPCQEAIPSAKPGEWWTTMEEVFHSN